MSGRIARFGMPKKPPAEVHAVRRLNSGLMETLNPAVPGLAGEASFNGGGHLTACALMVEGSLASWGDTFFGQRGDGSARWK